MSTESQLTQTFCDNFMAYFKSHVSHVNIVGRNFQSDHALLNGIYDELQDQIDTIGELLRSLDAMMPNSIKQITETSYLSDNPVEGRADELLVGVMDDLEILKGTYEDLMADAERDGHKEIANYAQDRILSLAKHLWMLKSTLA